MSYLQYRDVKPRRLIADGTGGADVTPRLAAAVVRCTPSRYDYARRAASDGQAPLLAVLASLVALRKRMRIARELYP
jgi:hypothetical protein